MRVVVCLISDSFLYFYMQHFRDMCIAVFNLAFDHRGPIAPIASKIGGHLKKIGTINKIRINKFK